MSPARAVALLAELDRRGVALVVSGEGLRYHPASAVPAALRERMRALKDELIDAVRTRVASAPTPAINREEASGSAAPPTAPCYCCEGREYVRVVGGPLWICQLCHGPRGERRIVERHTVPAPRPSAPGQPEEFADLIRAIFNATEVHDA